MAWEGSTRKATLPPDWEKIRRRVLRRDGYQCTWRNVYGERCGEPATDCDHIGNRMDHSLENLRALCSWHHNKRSAAQGARAAAREKAKREQRFRRTEEHPAFLVMRRQG